MWISSSSDSPLLGSSESPTVSLSGIIFLYLPRLLLILMSFLLPLPFFLLPLALSLLRCPSFLTRLVPYITVVVILDVRHHRLMYFAVLISQL